MIAVMSSRIDMIRTVVAQKPDDPFPRYGLAMALRSANLTDEALAEFAELSTRFPGYVPQYLMHAQLLISLSRTTDAREILVKGIAAAKTAGDGHAMSELEGLLDSL
jgi:hypothetical protein